MPSPRRVQRGEVRFVVLGTGAATRAISKHWVMRHGTLVDSAPMAFAAAGAAARRSVARLGEVAMLELPPSALMRCYVGADAAARSQQGLSAALAAASLLHSALGVSPARRLRRLIHHIRKPVTAKIGMITPDTNTRNL